MSYHIRIDSIFAKCSHPITESVVVGESAQYVFEQLWFALLIIIISEMLLNYYFWITINKFCYNQPTGMNAKWQVPIVTFEKLMCKCWPKTICIKSTGRISLGKTHRRHLPFCANTSTTPHSLSLVSNNPKVILDCINEEKKNFR